MPRRNNGPRLRFLKKRNCFYIFWTDHGCTRERSTGTSDGAAAQISFAAFMQEHTRDNSGPRNPNEVYVTDVLVQYAEERGPNVAAPVRIASSLQALIPFWTGKTVAQVTDQACRDYAASRGLSDGTTRRELGTLRAAINWSHKQGSLSRTVNVWLPNRPEPKERWLTRNEFAALLRASMDGKARLYLPLLMLMAVYTGRRLSALLDLRWHQINLETGIIDFRQKTIGEATKKRGRIKAPPSLIAHLRRARLRGVELGYVIHTGDCKRIDDPGKGFDGARNRAGLGTDVTFHTLKHTCGSWILQSGVPIWTASKYLETSIATLERVYAHHDPEQFSDVHAGLSRRPQNVLTTTQQKRRFSGIKGD
jgi:integrase